LFSGKQPVIKEPARGPRKGGGGNPKQMDNRGQERRRRRLSRKKGTRGNKAKTQGRGNYYVSGERFASWIWGVNAIQYK